MLEITCRECGRTAAIETPITNFHPELPNAPKSFKSFRIEVVCSACQWEEVARASPHRGAPLDANRPETLGSARNEPTHMGTQTEGEA